MAETGIEPTRRYVREVISRAYALVHSTSRTQLSLALSVDDVRELALEEIEGPADPDLPLLPTKRALSEIERIEEISNHVGEVVSLIRGEPQLVDDDG